MPHPLDCVVMHGQCSYVVVVLLVSMLTADTVYAFKYNSTATYRHVSQLSVV